MTDKTPTADDFATAEFARHSDGRTAVRGHAPLGGRPWSTAGWVEYTDADMAQGGWSPVRECPDPEQHRDPLDFQTSFPSPAKGMRYQTERDEARAMAALWKKTAREHIGRARTALSYADAAQLARAVAAVTPCSCSAQRARAEKAEQERDHWKREADGANEDLAHLRAAESRPLTPDAITDEMVERARNAPSFDGRLSPTPRIVREMLTAALTEPPARPEGAEDLTEVLRAYPGVAVDIDRIANHLAEHGVRVVGEDGAA